MLNISVKYKSCMNNMQFSHHWFLVNKWIIFSSWSSPPIARKTEERGDGVMIRITPSVSCQHRSYLYSPNKPKKNAELVYSTCKEFHERNTFYPPQFRTASQLIRNIDNTDWDCKKLQPSQINLFAFIKQTLRYSWASRTVVTRNDIKLSCLYSLMFPILEILFEIYLQSTAGHLIFLVFGRKLRMCN